MVCMVSLVCFVHSIELVCLVYLVEQDPLDEQNKADAQDKQDQTDKSIPNKSSPPLTRMVAGSGNRTRSLPIGIENCGADHGASGANIGKGIRGVFSMCIPKQRFATPFLSR